MVRDPELGPIERRPFHGKALQLEARVVFDVVTAAACAAAVVGAATKKCR
jgi:hypothetical protein